MRHDGDQSSLEDGTEINGDRADGIQKDVTHRIRLRYYPGFTMKCRLAWFDPNLNTTRYFNLHSVLDLEERHRLHECLAKEVV